MIILVANEDEARHLNNLPDDVEIIITGEGRSNVIKTLFKMHNLLV